MTREGRVLPPTPANEKYATRLSLEIRKAIGNGSFKYEEFFPDSKRAKEQRSLPAQVQALMPDSELPKNSIGAALDLWLLTEGNIKNNTKSQYETAIRFWKELFGKATPVTDLDHDTVEVKIAQYPWKSPEQHNNYLIALRGAFERAFRNNPTANPVLAVKNKERAKSLPDPFSAEERDKILAYMLGHYDIRVYAYFLWQFTTGMRPEETIALRWSDVDLGAKTVRVQRVRTFGEDADRTKTRFDRLVDLVGPALEALELMRPYTFGKRVHRVGKDRHDASAEIFERPAFHPEPSDSSCHPGIPARSRGLCNDCYQRWWREQKAAGIKIERLPHSGGRGKPSPEGPWQDERSQRETYWKPALLKLGIRYRRAYGTRATYCTIALLAGIPPAYIAYQAGHDLKTLLKDYARWIPGGDGGRVRDAMDKAFGTVKESRKGRRSLAVSV